MRESGEGGGRTRREGEEAEEDRETMQAEDTTVLEGSKEEACC